MKPAECLIGLTLETGWRVLSVINKNPAGTGGHFSVGYIVDNPTGKRAFLKALDFSAAFQAHDFTRALQEMTTAYNFERDLLNKCKGKKMTRVSTPIAEGEVEVPANFGPLNKVCYLIFDIAEGDIRNEITKFQAFDIAWSLRTLHHSAVGLWQLHQSGIAHQDLKPSNVLFFKEAGSKISDLGRASDVTLGSLFDNLQIPGDQNYAPPEMFYRGSAPPDFSARKSADLYMLGSLIFFLFAGCSANTAIKAKLGQAPGFSNFRGNDFQHDLPYLKHAFFLAVDDLKNHMMTFSGLQIHDIIQMTLELCDPNPEDRGDLKNRNTVKSQFNLERYISRLNVLAKKSEIYML